jgi:hypothetical protein
MSEKMKTKAKETHFAKRPRIGRSFFFVALVLAILAVALVANAASFTLNSGNFIGTMQEGG